MNEKLKNILQWTAFILSIGAIFFMMSRIPPEHHYYEIHSADGTIYHTTRIAHGTGRIWFDDEKGNSVELGGGYTVIEK
jgi:hypothetical protein